MLLALTCAVCFVLAMPMLLIEGGVIQQRQVPRWLSFRVGMTAFLLFFLMVLTEFVFMPAFSTATEAADKTPTSPGLRHSTPAQTVHPATPLVVTRTRTITKTKVVRKVVVKKIYVPVTTAATVRQASVRYAAPSSKSHGKGHKK